VAGLWDLYAAVRRWTTFGVSGDGIRLREGPDLRHQVDVLAAGVGGRAGLDTVLDDLDQRAVVVEVPAIASDYGFRWNDEDCDDREWWPQGISTSADAGDADDVAGRKVVVVAWYAKRIKGLTQGSRLTFVDVTDPRSPRYRHVLLVEPTRHRFTRKIVMRPVPVHAGGIVWYAKAILVADTVGGIRRFDLDDILRVDGGWRGYEYVLPQRTSYQAINDRGFAPFRFSFVSLDRSGPDHQLIAGEYGKAGSRNRLIRFAIDADKASLATAAGYARPLEIILDGLTHMQGATVVGDTYYISTSRGNRPGTLWVRRPGESPAEHRGVLTVGPEDLTYWPQTDRLWNCSEHPGRRYVYAIPRERLRATRSDSDGGDEVT
jgi:hypothetical protein